MIHPTVKIGKNVKIISADITIGEGTEIGDNSTIIAYERLVIGKFCKIRPNAHFTARVIEIGDWFYSDDNPRPLIIGGGGSDRPEAIVKIGNRCVIHDSLINSPVEIGDDVGLSPSSDISTHGFWNSVLDGYSEKHGLVKIGHDTIIGYRAIILANVTIGHHCSVGAGAIVTKDIPDYCVVVGVPAKIIAGSPDYPKQLSKKEKEDMCWQIVMQYAKLLEDKVDDLKVKSEPDVITIKGFYKENFEVTYANSFVTIEYSHTIFVMNLINKNWSGEDNEISDDFRDFLRHYGIRIFSTRWFKSIDSKVKRGLNK